MYTKSLIIALSFATLLVDATRHDLKYNKPNQPDTFNGVFQPHGDQIQERSELNKRLYTIVFQGDTLTYPDKPSFVTSSEFKNVPQGYVPSPSSNSYHSAPSIVQASNSFLVSHQGYTVTPQVSRQGIAAPSGVTGISREGASSLVVGATITRHTIAATPVYQAQEGRGPG